MIRLLTDIPDYDDELERLSNTTSFDLGAALNSFFSRLFNLHIDPVVFDLLKILAYIVLAVVVFWYIYREFHLNDLTFAESHSNVVPRSGLQGTAADSDIRGHNFEKELKEALQNEDYAEAVRLRYLYTLQQLNGLNIIAWKEWKTPLMYVDEMESNAELLKELTMTFLYIKYGHYPANQDTYNHACELSNHLVINEKGGAQ